MAPSARLAILALLIACASTTLKVFFAMQDEQRALQRTTNPETGLPRWHAHTAIPRRLWFTYKHDLLTNPTPPILAHNVQKTIEMYRRAWNDPRAPAKVLDNDDCRDEIQRAEPRMVAHFDAEPKGMFKADICISKCCK